VKVFISLTCYLIGDWSILICLDIYNILTRVSSGSYKAFTRGCEQLSCFSGANYPPPSPAPLLAQTAAFGILIALESQILKLCCNLKSWIIDKCNTCNTRCMNVHLNSNVHFLMDHWQLWITGLNNAIHQLQYFPPWNCILVFATEMHMKYKLQEYNTS